MPAVSHAKPHTIHPVQMMKQEIYNKSKLQMKVTLAPVHRAPLLAVHPARKGVPFATHLTKVHTYMTSGEQDSPCTSDSMEIGSGPFRKFNKKSVCNLFSMPLGDLVSLSQYQAKRDPVNEKQPPLTRD